MILGLNIQWAHDHLGQLELLTVEAKLIAPF